LKSIGEFFDSVENEFPEQFVFLVMEALRLELGL
jgi:hypothetical protein